MLISSKKFVKYVCIPTDNNLSPEKGTSFAIFGNVHGNAIPFLEATVLPILNHVCIQYNVRYQ